MESAHIHVMSGVSSRYAVKSSALHKTREAITRKAVSHKFHNLTMSTFSPTDKARLV